MKLAGLVDQVHPEDFLAQLRFFDFRMMKRMHEDAFWHSIQFNFYVLTKMIFFDFVDVKRATLYNPTCCTEAL